ncbi:MAG: ThuA domain-containing protein [Bryobacterales bacterium]|nr:ThuA domain-containing protein [Bryobacterales bacterium]
MTRSEFLRVLAAGAAAPLARPRPAAGQDGPLKLVLIAGSPSHPPGMHEFRAGTLLLERRLAQLPGLVVERYDNGWVADEGTLDTADALVIYSDGARKHPLRDKGRLALVGRLVGGGMGLGCMHYGVEVVPEDAGEEFRQWLGGHYEHEWSCNPIWTPAFEQFPDHPVANGVRPFAVEDEWYFNMRFRAGFDASGPREIDGARFTPILVAKPSDEVRDGPYVYPKGPYAHIQAAKGREEAMLWTLERPDGGRGFGFTGGHFHRNWQNDEYRKVVVNAIAWLAGFRVPSLGIGTSTVSDAEIGRNLDPKPARAG